jgi:hypothetical protein
LLTYPSDGLDIMTDDHALRSLLSRLLSWEDAHVSFDTAVSGLPERDRGTRPPGASHSAWELVEHLRLAQEDILEFCVNPDYRERHWPDGYWPSSPAPPSDAAWHESVAQYKRDRERFQKLAEDPDIDLHAAIPHGSGQTYARELVLAADHAAYHVGQLVLVRQLLGNWKAGK